MKKIILLTISLFIGINLYAQDSPKYEFKGYVKDLQNVFIPNPDTSVWFSDNTLDNRLQLTYYPFQWLKFDVQSRNRFIYGDFVEMIPNYGKYIDKDMGYFDLSFLWGNGNSYIAHTAFDRLNATINIKSWQITLGRQRINWGMDLAWNPNDIFNTYSYFDLEYPERPGTDAVSVKYYSGIASFAEGVYQLAETWDSTSLGFLYRFNTHEFDIQALVGKMRSNLVAGVGWSGNVGNAALRGEVSYFNPYTDKDVQDNGVIASLSADYSFADSWYVQVGGLYNSFGKTKNQGSIDLLAPTSPNPKMLSKGRYNIFTSLSGKFGPLVTPTLSAIANPSDGSLILIPSISISAADNINVALTGMILTGESETEYQNIGQLVYLKFEWNF
jgi:hypothetical protein